MYMQMREAREVGHAPTVTKAFSQPDRAKLLDHGTSGSQKGIFNRPLGEVMLSDVLHSWMYADIAQTCSLCDACIRSGIHLFRCCSCPLPVISGARGSDTGRGCKTATYITFQSLLRRQIIVFPAMAVR